MRRCAASGVVAARSAASGDGGKDRPSPGDAGDPGSKMGVAKKTAALFGGWSGERSRGGVLS